MNIFKRLVCKHEFGVHGFSYVKCKKCGKVKRDPPLSFKLISKECAEYVEAGLWDKAEVEEKMREQEFIMNGR